MDSKRKDYQRYKQRNRYFNLFKVGDLVRINVLTKWDRTITGRLININENNNFMFEKPNGRHRWELYRKIEDKSIGMYLGRHDGGAVVLIDEKRYWIPIEYLLVIKSGEKNE